MNIKLVCFDVDGTLIDDGDGGTNVWQEVHREVGIPDAENEGRFEQFMAGEITYSQWVDIDVGGWQKAGVTRDQILGVVRQLNLMQGARACVTELQQRGYGLAVISGSLNFGLETLYPDHPFDPVFINRVFFNGDGQISHWEATPFDLEEKSVALRMIAETQALSLEECAFVGDSFNDVDVAAAAGFSIAFNSKSENLNLAADQIVPFKDLSLILPFFPAIQ